MRTARNLLLVAIAALAALAFSATSASATGISVSEGGVPCSDVVVNDHEVSGGCVSHVTSEGTIELGAQIPFFGYVHQSNCNNEYTLRFDSAGEGTITDFNISGCTSSTTECPEAQAHGGGSMSWPAHAEESAPGTLSAVIVACITTGSIRCEGAFAVSIVDTTATGENLEAESADRAPIGTSVCRVTGHWILENNGIEITH
jgi:hypothetical protein